MTIPRIQPQELRSRIQDSDPGPIVVCAYDEDEKCEEHSIDLDGATTLSELQQNAPVEQSMPLVFYCS